MGRQSYLVRLALGRSPFDLPLKDDRDQFILGPNVQHDTARNYVQEFDSTGHPYNLGALYSKTRLVRAQNDALETVGVVVRKAKMNRSKWQSLSHHKQQNCVVDEDLAGHNYNEFYDFLQSLALRWIKAFRKRLLIYRSYVGLTVFATMQSEWNIVGAGAFLLPGFSMGAIARLSKDLRDDTLEQRPNPVRIFHPVFRFQGASGIVLKQFLKLAWFSLEYPFYATSILQSLYLLPQNSMPPVTDLLPLSVAPRLRLSNDHVLFSWPSFLRAARNFFLHPFVLAYIREICGRHVYLSIYAVVRQAILKPDRPDQVSLQTTGYTAVLVDQRFARPAAEETFARQDHGHRQYVEFVRTLFAGVFQLWERVLQARETTILVDPPSDLEDQLIARTSEYYQALLEEERGLRPEQRRPRRTLRLQAMRSAFSHYNLVPDGMLGGDWVEEAIGRFDDSRASTSTPDPQDFFSVDDLMELQIDERSTNMHGDDATESVQIPPQSISLGEQEIPNGEVTDFSVAETTEPLDVSATSAFEPIMPLEALLEERPPGAQTTPELRPLTPELGISRAASLPQVTPRPVRRPTDLGEDNRPTREELVPHRNPPHVTGDGDDTQYRVTTLSNHPADALARNIASIITPILMLPLETLFLRSLTRTFLISRSGDNALSERNPPLAHLWPLSPRTSVEEFGVLRSQIFWGNWFLSLGIQGMVSLVTWTCSSYLTLHLGRDWYGWGEF